MVTKTLKIDGASGKVGIVNYANAAVAFSNPLSNLADVYFHSDLEYVKFISKISCGTISLATVPQTYYTYDSGGGGHGGGFC